MPPSILAPFSTCDIYTYLSLTDFIFSEISNFLLRSPSLTPLLCRQCPLLFLFQCSSLRQCVCIYIHSQEKNLEGFFSLMLYILNVFNEHTLLLFSEGSTAICTFKTILMFNQVVSCCKKNRLSYILQDRVINSQILAR